MTSISRRHFLTAGAVAAAVPALAPSARAARPAQGGAVPRDVGRKFKADGSVSRFGGNTFVGHVQQQGRDYDQFDGLLDIYREFPAHGFASKIALTPPNSYHVTVFGGLNDEDQGTPRWPRALPPGMSVDAVTQQWLRGLQARPRLAEPRFEFAYGTAVTMSDGAPHVPLLPANDATARRLKAVRDALSEFTGIRDKNHDSYQYHLTVGYIHQLLTEPEAQSLRTATDDWVARLSARSATLVIPAFHFCSFRDMYAFRELHAL